MAGGHIWSALWTVIHKDLFARAYWLSQPHKEVAAAIVHAGTLHFPSCCSRSALRSSPQQVCVQVFAPIWLVAVTIGPSSDWYSAVLHELGMGVHHSSLSRASSAHAVHFSTVRVICGGAVCPRYHASPGFLSLADLDIPRRKGYRGSLANPLSQRPTPFAGFWADNSISSPTIPCLIILGIWQYVKGSIFACLRRCAATHFCALQQIECAQVSVIAQKIVNYHESYSR